MAGVFILKGEMKTCLSGTVQCRSPTFPVAAKLGTGPPAGKQEGASSPGWNPLRPKQLRPTELCETQDPHMVAVRLEPPENHCGPWPVAAASPGNVLEMQALGTHPGLRSQKLWWRGPGPPSGSDMPSGLRPAGLAFEKNSPSVTVVTVSSTAILRSRLWFQLSLLSLPLSFRVKPGQPLSSHFCL